jgi:hypothetical protein
VPVPGDPKLGEGASRPSPAKFSVGDDGFCVGRDSGDPVIQDGRRHVRLSATRREYV